MILPALLFFLRIAWLFGVFCVSVKGNTKNLFPYKFFCSNSMKNAIGTLVEISLIL